MNFASFPYLVFLALSLLLYFNLPHKVRPLFLLIASYTFYAFFGVGFVLLMLFTSLATFICARSCYNTTSKEMKLFFFLAGLGIDLGVFILFKYFHVINIDLMNWPGWSVQKLLIPVGISFYTFKTLGYCIDIYRGKHEPEPSFIYYAASVAFFPQLIAGPIEKSHTIIKQLKSTETFRTSNITDGAKLILWGLFKKLVIADSIAQVINPVFNNVKSYTGLDLIIALLAFVYQVYTDFSGYSDVAIGSAKCFGVELPANFNKPLFARNLFDFWRRWHTTFYKWIKEYVYDYLLMGKVKVPKIVVAFKIAVIFLLVGFWHGATINYLLYAAAAYVWVLLDLVSRKLRRNVFSGIRKRKFFLRSLSYFSTVFMVASMCIFFRPGSVADSLYLIKHVIHSGTFKIGFLATLYLLCAILIFELLQSLQVTAKGHCFEKVRNFYIRGAMYAGLIFLIILLSSRPDVTFQYFQF